MHAVEFFSCRLQKFAILDFCEYINQIDSYISSTGPEQEPLCVYEVCISQLYKDERISMQGWPTMDWFC